MLRKIAIPSALAASTLATGLAAAGTPVLPTYGHYLGTGTVVAASGCPATEVAGAAFQNQLELNTPAEKLVVYIRQVYPGTAPDYVPQVTRTILEKSGGTHLSPTGKMVIKDEVGGESWTGTYNAAYTPLDLNSFLANISISYAYTPPGGTAGTCDETVETAYVRSSAD